MLVAGLDGALGAGVESELDSTLNCEPAAWLACRVLSCARAFLVNPWRLAVFGLVVLVDWLSAIVGGEVLGSDRAGVGSLAFRRFSMAGFGSVLRLMRSTPARPGPITPVAVHAAIAVAQTPAAALPAGLPMPIAVSPPPEDRSLVAKSRVRSTTATAPERTVSIVPPILPVIHPKRLSDALRLSHAASPMSNSGTGTPKRLRRLRIAASRLLLKVGSLHPSALAPSRVVRSSK